MSEQKDSKKWIGYELFAPMAVVYLCFGTHKTAIREVQWDVQTAFLITLTLVIIEEVIPTATKAFVSSMFITAVLFVIGFWTFLSADIPQQGGVVANLPTFLTMMMVIHLGTMLDIQELIDQWKTIVVTLAGMLGILVVILIVRTLVLGKGIAAVTAPPLTGGLVAAMMMQSVAPIEHPAVLAMTICVLRGFMGYPLTNICLKKEGYPVLNQYRKGIRQTAAVQKMAAAEENKHVLFPQLLGKYKNDFTYLFTMVILTMMSGYLDKPSGGYISKFVWALTLGVFAITFGFTEKNILVRSRSMDFVYTIIMMFVLSQLSGCTPDTVVQLIKGFVILIMLSAIGIAAFAIPLGKKFGMSMPMAFALGLGSIAGGFPASYALNVEATKVYAEDGEEYQVLEQYMLPKALVAGFVSATSGSVFIAGAVMVMFFK